MSMGKFHFTKDTVQASIWCNRCNKNTQWKILQGKRAYCIPCYERPADPEQTREDRFVWRRAEKGNQVTEAEFSYEVGEKIRQKRIQRKMSREVLARMIHVHRNTIWRWEDGDCPIPLWGFLQICYALSMPHTMMLPNTSLRNTALLNQVERESLPSRRLLANERDRPMSERAERRERGIHGNKRNVA
jgi:transcriptional regulator with XRE-family HTH domain